MTMHEQELTLFGGWAKAQILPPIEIGVVKISAMPLASIYIDNSYTPTDKKALTVRASISTDLFDEMRPNTSLMYVMNEYNIKPRVGTCMVIRRTFIDEWGQQQSNEDYEPLDPTEKWIRRECGDHGQYIDFMPTSWTRIFLRSWLDKIFLRFFEIWEHGTHATIARGLAGTEKLKRSISGMIGGNYNGGFKDGKKALTKLSNGEYAISNINQLHKGATRLPEEGIINARKLAKQLQQKRINTSRKIES